MNLKITRTLIVLIALLVSPYIYAQHIMLPLQQKIGFGPFPPDNGSIIFAPDKTHPAYDSFAHLVYTNIPSDWSNVKKGLIMFDMLQFLYQSSFTYLDPKIYQQFKTERNFKIHDDDLSQEPIACFVRIVFGTSADGQEVYLLDKNQNGDFSDETITKLEELDIQQPITGLKERLSMTHFDLNNGNKTVRLSIPLLIFKSRFGYAYSIPSYNEALYKSGDTTHILYAGHQFRFPDYWVSDLLIDADTKNIIAKSRKFVLDNRKYKNLGVDPRSNQLTIVEVDPDSRDSNLSDFQHEDIQSRETIDTESLKGKYILLDFWGSWCGPCLAQLPKLAEIYRNLDRSKIEIIGVAGRDKYKNAYQAILEHKIPWKNILSDQKNNLTEIYGIVKYPTCILIDPEGNIVEKDISTHELTDILAKYKLF
ncbi:TlpA family protein disulfide reductase [Sphingobacterium faecale]|uniref:TlpA family protein disulfide reductase n=1 Tax=Sphingobacterium faecale TaxID=2803775 RepID=A0ABS1R037_9SPHI|nr:TlpA disulfide reductase family protein [Sphingobacterium faecale]MBL1408038.1 TlpA family protein disulfide reductase [Sphingobacterium faecale]